MLNDSSNEKKISMKLAAPVNLWMVEPSVMNFDHFLRKREKEEEQERERERKTFREKVQSIGVTFLIMLLFFFS